MGEPYKIAYSNPESNIFQAKKLELELLVSRDVKKLHICRYHTCAITTRGLYTISNPLFEGKKHLFWVFFPESSGLIYG